MARTLVIEQGPEGTERVGWFNAERAECFKAETYWDGNNNVDVNTGDAHRRQSMWRTAMGRWVLRNWSAWQGEQDVWSYVSEDEAREWLIRNGHDEAVTKHFGEIEEERGPGRPEIGGAVHVRLGEYLERLDELAALDGMSRAEAIRLAVERYVEKAQRQGRLAPRRQ